jgi:hypothetical protein
MDSSKCVVKKWEAGVAAFKPSDSDCSIIDSQNMSDLLSIAEGKKPEE